MVWDLPVPVIATAVGSFCGFLTAVAGFGLNAWLTWKRQQEATALQVANVRTLIACEIDHNLQALRTHLDGLDSLWSNAYHADADVPRVVKVKPQYSQEAYRSQMSLMPLALSQDEIRGIIKLYSDLENLDRDDQREWLTVQLMKLREGHAEKRNTMLVDDEQRFYKGEKVRGWEAHMKFARDLLSQGNPLLS